jgi:chromosomal replication initiation ATPase DnaA
MRSKVGQEHLSQARRREFTGERLKMADLDPPKVTDLEEVRNRKDISRLTKTIEQLLVDVSVLRARLPPQLRGGARGTARVLREVRKERREATQTEIDLLVNVYVSIYPEERVTLPALRSEGRSAWLARGRFIFAHLLRHHYSHLTHTEIGLYFGNHPTAVKYGADRGDALREGPDKEAIDAIERAWLKQLKQPTEVVA